MDDDNFPDFLRLNGFRVKPGMFGARRRVAGVMPAVTRPAPAAPLQTEPTPAASPTASVLPPPYGPTRLSGLSVSADQLKDWVRTTNRSGGLHEPLPSRHTIDSDAGVRKAATLVPPDSGGPDTMLDPETYAFMDQARHALARLKVNSLPENVLKSLYPGQDLHDRLPPELCLAISRDHDGHPMISDIRALGPQGGACPVPPDAIASAHTHSTGQAQPPNSADSFPLIASGKPSFVLGEVDHNLFEIGRHDGIVQIRLVRDSNHFGPWEPFQADYTKYRRYKDPRAGG